MIIIFLQRFVSSLLRIYELLLIARAILSWFPMVQGNAIDAFLYNVTEPVLAPIRNVIWKIPFLANMPIDFSILVAFLLIDVLRTIIFYI